MNLLYGHGLFVAYTGSVENGGLQMNPEGQSVDTESLLEKLHVRLTPSRARVDPSKPVRLEFFVYTPGFWLPAIW